MDSVDEIQKINNLAKELIKHRIAGTSDEALRQAEKMIKGKETPRETKAVEDNFNREIRAANLRIDSLIKDINDLKDSIKSLAEHVRELKQKTNEPKSETRQEEKIVNVEKKADDTPKKGKKGFSEEDVCIEKIFYYGKK